MFISFLATRCAQIIGTALAALTLVVLPPAGNSQAEEGMFGKAQTEAIEGIVRAYLLAHPEIVGEAVAKLQAQEEAAREAAIRVNLNKIRADVEQDSKTPVLGNPAGDVTITEFHDYRCGYCKLVYQTLMKVVKEDGHIRLVLKDLPILGPDSYASARAALAAHAQGRYAMFLDEGMKHRSPFNAEALEIIAQRIGLDVAQFRKDLESAEIDQQLEKNRNLAQVLDISGTPVFIIGDVMMPGAINEKQLIELVARARH